MSDQIVKIDMLDTAIKKELDSMNQRVATVVNDSAIKTADEAVKELRKTSPVRKDGFARRYPPGSYAKGWKKRLESTVLGVKTYSIYNDKHYQLTHLLEFGHVIAKGKNKGKRTKAIPHIKPVNDKSATRFEKLVKEGLSHDL